MRKVLTGTIEGNGRYGSLTIRTGALSDDEVRWFSGSTVEIRKQDSAESLLAELLTDLAPILERPVMSTDRNSRIKDIRDRARAKGVKV